MNFQVIKKMKRIIVTGGLGFIGSNLIDLLIKKNYFVINIDKKSDVFESSQENLNLVNETNHIDNQVLEDAISALVNLGYNRSEVFSIVMKIKKEFTLKHESKDFTVGNIIPLALKAITQVTK